MKTVLLLFLSVFVVPINIMAQATLGFEEHLLSTYAEGAAHSDIDGDGDLDMFLIFSESPYSNPHKRLVWLENIDGKGHYGQPNIIAENTSYKTLISADINGDGKMDLVAAFYKISWFENLGQGNFGPEQNIGYSEPNYLFAKDMDGDGDVDVVSANKLYNQDDTISWRENLNGQGSFGPEQIILSTYESIYYASVNDLDNDGDLDVLAELEDGDELVWHENLGQGAFSGTPKEVIDILPYDIILPSDIDGDADLDLLVSYGYVQAIFWYENLGGSFNYSQTLISTGGDIYGMVSFDLDADADMDILSFESPDTYFYENTGQGNFVAPQISTLNLFERLDFADLEGDGDKDLLWSSSHTKVWNENLNGQGNFAEGQLLYLSTGTNLFDLGDIDGDADLDVFFRGTIYKKLNGQWIYEPVYIGTNPTLYGETKFVKITDMDGDSDMDLFIIESGGTFWHENLNGQGDFGPGQLFTLSYGTDSDNKATAGDFDNDGDLDLLRWRDDPNQNLVWRENTGQGDFGPEQTLSANVLSGPLTNLYATDIDGDADLDVLCTDNLKVAWYENTDGQGSFGSQQVVSALYLGGALSLIYPSDIDGDGDQDVLATSSHEIVWHENTNGQGTFGNSNHISMNVDFPRTAHTGDLDDDGDKDLIIGTTDDLVWYENLDGQGSFGSKLAIDSYFYGHPLCILAHDITGNANKDILVSTSGGISWYENLGPLGTKNDFGKKGTKNIFIYPNPANDKLNIAGDFRVIEAKVYNGLGQELFFLQNGEGIKSVDLNGLSQGLYFIKLKGGNGKSTVKKFLKMD